MGKFKDEHGKTRIGKFLKTAGEIAPELLQAAGKITGVEMLENIGEMIDKDAKLTEDQKAVAHDLIKLDMADIQSARNMQIAALQQADVFSKRYIYYLASVVIVAAIAFGIMLFYVDVPEGNKRLVEMFSDIFLFAGAVMVLQFFFGSSNGSREKTLLMKK